MTPTRLPDVENPKVSLVMVTFGGGETALRAIEALVWNTEPNYELIVIDNASADDTADRLTAGLVGATVVLNAENAGFARGCNQGAELASGGLLCFLNPDAFVEAGWLPPLLEVFKDSKVGAALPLFLHPDGRVQEAGSAVDSEGTALAIGDGDDPRSFEYRFTRMVDYGSAGVPGRPRGPLCRGRGL